VQLASHGQPGVVVGPILMFGHPDIVYVPIRDMPPLRSALVWQRESQNPWVPEFVRVAAEVVTGDGHLRS
jgi:hypothetical protein